MNAQRRKRIAAIRETVEEAQRDLRELQDEEQAAYDSMPESIQAGSRGDASNEAIENLGTAADDLDTILFTLDDAAK